MYSLFSFVLAVLPAVLLVRFYYRQDFVSPEPKSLIIKVFLLGIVYTLPVYVLEWAVTGMNIFEHISPLLFYFFEAFVVAGLCEEYIKRRIVLKHIYHDVAFNESVDGIVYAVVAGLGFACMENIIYVMKSDWHTAIARGFTAIPMHAVASGIMGYYVGKAKFAKSPKEERFLINKGLWQAVLIHGWYDFILFLSPFIGSIFSFLAVQVILTAYFKLKRSIRLAQEFDKSRADNKA